MARFSQNRSIENLKFLPTLLFPRPPPQYLQSHNISQIFWGYIILPVQFSQVKQLIS